MTVTAVVLAIIRGYLLKLNVVIEGNPGLTIYCKSSIKPLPLALGGGTSQRGRGLISRAALFNLANYR